MKINIQTNKVNEDMLNKTKTMDSKFERKKENEVPGINKDASPINSFDKQKKSPHIDKIELSDSEIKIKSKSNHQRNMQDRMTIEHLAQSTISSLQEHAVTLMELSSKHQKTDSENQSLIEHQSKELLKTMKEISATATMNGRNVLEGKYNLEILSNIETVDMKEVLKPDNIDTNLIQPLKEAKNTIDVNVQNIVASLSGSQLVSMTQTEAHTIAQKVKESLKDTDIRKVSSPLDNRRENVSYLLK